MFRGFINDAKAAASSFIDRYLARASVAVPFIIAFGFATAAAALALTARFGATRAFSIMAAGFSVIGLLAAVAVTLKEQKEQETEAAEAQQAESSSGLGEMATVATQAAGQLPLGLVTSVLGSSSGSGSVMALERFLRRHLPLLVLLGLLALLLLWPGEGEQAEARNGSAEEEGRRDEDAGPVPPEPASMREAA